jgi:hypothetical protein
VWKASESGSVPDETFVSTFRDGRGCRNRDGERVRKRDSYRAKTGMPNGPKLGFQMGPNPVRQEEQNPARPCGWALWCGALMGPKGPSGRGIVWRGRDILMPKETLMSLKSNA